MDLFEQNDNNDNNNISLDSFQLDTNKNYLEELVGEGKKFKTQEDLAKGKYLADLFIEHKNREYDQLRKDYLELREQANSAARINEIYDLLSKSTQGDDDTQDADNNVQKATFDPKEIENLVLSKIRETEQTKLQEQNARLVETKLREKYGENYRTYFQQQVDNLGLNIETAKSLAMNHPQVLIKTLGLDAQPSTDQFQPPMRTNIRQAQESSGTKRTWTWYEKLRKEQPAVYHDPKTQVQMHQDAIALGDAFKDGNWKALNSR